jgi:hypothetical protein
MGEPAAPSRLLLMKSHRPCSVIIAGHVRTNRLAIAGIPSCIPWHAEAMHQEAQMTERERDVDVVVIGGGILVRDRGSLADLG